MAAARPRGWALVAFVLLGVAGALGYLASGLFILLLSVMTPNPGAEAYVFLVKATAVVGWFAIGGWMLVKFAGFRWWFLAAPPGAWAWMYLAAMLLQANLNFGY